MNYPANDGRPVVKIGMSAYPFFIKFLIFFDFQYGFLKAGVWKLKF